MIVSLRNSIGTRKNEFRIVIVAQGERELPTTEDGTQNLYRMKLDRLGRLTSLRIVREISERQSLITSTSEAEPEVYGIRLA